MKSNLINFDYRWFKKYLELNTSLESGENYLASVKLLEEKLSKLGFNCEIIKIPDSIEKRPSRYNLIAKKNFGNNLPTIVLYNHMDTVPADYPGAFKYREEKDKIYSRGACDMKGATFAVLSALEKIQSSRFNIIFLGTTDEETFQKEQLNYLTKVLKLPKKTLVFDPDTMAGGVTIANLGLLQFKLIIKGKSTHSAMSHLGINAVEKSAEVISYLAQIKKTYEKISSQLPTFETDGLNNACNRINVNMISGGIAANVVPDKCTLTIDCRYIPELDVLKEKEKMFKSLKEFLEKKKIAYEITDIYTIEGYATRHKEVEVLEKIYHKLTGEKGQYAVMGSTEVSEWTKYLKLPHFGIGVIRNDNNIHGVNEFVYKKDIESLARAMISFLAS